MKHKLDIIVVMETNINSSTVQRVIQWFKIPNYIKNSLEGLSEGIWLLWLSNLNVVVDIIYTSKVYSMQNHDKEKDVSWLGMFIYGCPHYHLQKHLWKQTIIRYILNHGDIWIWSCTYLTYYWSWTNHD